MSTCLSTSLKYFEIFTLDCIYFNLLGKNVRLSRTLLESAKYISIRQWERAISIVFMRLSVTNSSLPVWRHILTGESFRWLVQNFTPYKGIQDSLGFWIPRRGFWILGTRFQSFSVELGFWIRIVRRIPDSLSCILDSKAQDFGFHKQNFPRFRIARAKISWIRESE